jgi:hypothetical protein
MREVMREVRTRLEVEVRTRMRMRKMNYERVVELSKLPGLPMRILRPLGVATFKMINPYLLVPVVPDKEKTYSCNIETRILFTTMDGGDVATSLQFRYSPYLLANMPRRLITVKF